MCWNTNNHIIIPNIRRYLKRRQFAICCRQHNFCIYLFITTVIAICSGCTNYQICFKTIFFATLTNIKSGLIRAGVCSDCFTAKMVKEHNHCQIIAMGARVVGTELAKMIVDNFFEAEEQGGRHAARVDMITQIERDYGYADAPVK